MLSEIGSAGTFWATTFSESRGSLTPFQLETRFYLLGISTGRGFEPNAATTGNIFGDNLLGVGTGRGFGAACSEWLLNPNDRNFILLSAICSSCLELHFQSTFFFLLFWGGGTEVYK